MENQETGQSKVKAQMRKKRSKQITKNIDEEQKITKLKLPNHEQNQNFDISSPKCQENQIINLEKNDEIKYTQKIKDEQQNSLELKQCTSNENNQEQIKRIQQKRRSLYEISNAIHGKAKKKSKKILKSKKYETLVLIFIIVNFTAYMLKDFSYRLYKVDSNNSKNIELDQEQYINTSNQISIILEAIACIFFFGEFVIKFIAWGPQTYFKNGWEMCNFIILWCGIYYTLVSFEYFYSLENFHSLENQDAYKICASIRKVRVFRLNYSVKLLKQQVHILLKTIPATKAIIVPIMYIVLVYSLVGLYLFKGSLENRCRLTSEPVLGEFIASPDIPNLCGDWICPDGTYCRNPFDEGMPFDNKEAEIPDLNWGITHFNNIYASMFVVAHFIAISNFNNFNNIYWKSVNSIATSTYFMTLTILLSFVTMNIFMSSLFQSFMHQKSKKQERKQLKQEKLKIQQFAHNANDTQQNNQGTINTEENQIVPILSPEKLPMKSPLKQNMNPEPQNLNNQVTVQHEKKTIKTSQDTRQTLTISELYELKQSQLKQIKHVQRKSIAAGLVDKSELFKALQAKIQPQMLEDETRKKTTELQKLQKRSLKQQTLMNNTKKRLKGIRYKIFIATDSNYYRGFIYFLIIVNLIIMLLDRYQISKAEKQAYNIIDFIITIMYSIHLIFIIYAQGPYRYFKNLLNFVDVIITIINIAQICYEIFYGINVIHGDSITGDGVISLKTFRILIILYYVEYFTVLRQLTKSLMKTIQSTAYLLAIFFIIFITTALVALELFANRIRLNDDEFTPKDASLGQPIRLNFDSFPNSMLAVFVMFFSEGWPYWMYQYFRAVKYDATAFFAVAIAIGQVIYLKLYLAFFIYEFNKQQLKYQRTEKQVIQELRQIKKQQSMVIPLDTKNDLDNASEKSKVQQRRETVIITQQNETGADFLQSTIKKQTTININSGATALATVENQNTNQNQKKLEKSEPESEPYQSKQKFFNKQNKNIDLEMTPIDKDVNTAPSYYNNSSQKQIIESNDTILITSLASSKNIDQKKKKIQIKKNSQKNKNNENKLEVQPSKFDLKEIISSQLNSPNPQTNTNNNHNKFNQKPKGQKKFFCIEENMQSSEEEEEEEEDDSSSSKSSSSNSNYDEIKMQQKEEKVKARSFFIFNPTNPFRLVCARIAKSKQFRGLIILLIILQNICLANRSKLKPDDDPTNQYMDLVIYIVNFIYFLEIIIFSVGGGFIIGEDSYLGSKHHWHKIDFLTIFLGLLSNFLNLRFAKAVMVLRLLRIIPAVKEIEIVTLALLHAMPNILRAFIFLFIFLIIFSPFLTKQKQGAFYECLGVDDLDKIDTVNDCFDYGGDWVSKDVAFDNTFMTLLSLYAVGTAKGWVNIMFDTIDARGEGLQPKENYNQAYAFYFLIFTLVFRLFLFKVFMAIMVRNYIKFRNKQIGFDLLTESQIEWVTIKTNIKKLKPIIEVKPERGPQKVIYLITKSPYYRFFLYSLIIVNIIDLCLIWHRQDPQIFQTIQVLNLTLMGVYFINFIFQIIVNGKIYLRQGRNWTDIVMISLTLINYIVFENSDKKNNVNNNNLLRVVAAMSVFFQCILLYKLLSVFPGTRKLFNTLINVLPLMKNFALLFLLLLCGFSIVAMQLFAYTKVQDYASNYDNSFQTFGEAWVTLLKVASPFDWFRVMHAYARQQQPNFPCFDIDNYSQYKKYGLEGCGTQWSIAFFVIFHLVFALILFNLFIASIMSAYEGVYKANNSAIDKYQLMDTLKLWKDHDQEGSGYVYYKNFWRFTSQSALLLGVSQEQLLEQDNKSKLLKFFDIPVYENKTKQQFCFKFHDVLIALTKFAIQIKYGNIEIDPDEYRPGLQTIENFGNGDQRKSKFLEKILKGKTLYSPKYIKTKYTSSHLTSFMYINSKIRQILGRKGKRVMHFTDIGQLKDKIDKFRQQNSNGSLQVNQVQNIEQQDQVIQQN